MSRTSALNDVRRFMKSSDGHIWLEGIRDRLQGRSIRRVTFAATDHGVTITLHLDNKNPFCFVDEELTLAALYERYSAFFAQQSANT